MRLLSLRPTCFLFVAQLLPTISAHATLAPPLVEVRSERLDAAGPSDLGTVEESIAVARDGLVEIRSIRRDVQASSSFAVATIRGTVAADDLGRLHAALAAARPRSFPARCLGAPVPLGAAYRTRLTWYPRSARSASVEIASDAAPRACSAELVALLDRIAALALAVTRAAESQVDSSTCVSDRQCPPGLLCCASGGVPDSPLLCLRPIEGSEGCPLFP